ncbi:hypothetical protein AALP_AAs50640U000100 [Arabis alpina]|uniref:Arabidopsis retrotransposon Orf1 C-terminal domain-containing protein n=1 Tax=Arabis alpina TaxID=50452 RepID=A0A087FYP5_ARAAL|nr:hypothetical protein AALP_AAs50640U000100 [Arabis alpina]
MTIVQAMLGYISRKSGNAWDDFNSLFYNGLLQVSMAPTRFICPRTLQGMGIAEDVRDMLRKMGLGTLAYKTYPLYPDLVRQFLASVELRFKDIAMHTADEGTLSYLCGGVLYEISIGDLCDIYGFDRSIQSCRFPTSFPLAAELWSFLGSGQFYSANSRKAKLTLIRNLVIRVIAKILGHSLNAKEATSSLRVDELMMVHYGLPIPHEIYGREVPSELSTNLGAIFAAMLVTRKSKGLHTNENKWKVERVGSLLTPIFQFHGIDLTSTRCVDTLEYYDERFFSNNQICDAGSKYKFYDHSLTLRSCELPLTHLSAPISRENLKFFMDPQHLLPDPAPDRRRCGSSKARASQQEDDRVSDDFPPQSPRTLEPLLPPYSSVYDLPPLPTATSDSARLKWIMDAQTQQHPMMTQMWQALAKLSCPRLSTKTSRRDADIRDGSNVARHEIFEEDEMRDVDDGVGSNIAGHGTFEEDGMRDVDNGVGPNVAEHGAPTEDEPSDERQTKRQRASRASLSANSEDN